MAPHSEQSQTSGGDVDLTIIVPVYNAAAHLDALMRDLLEITDITLQVIMVDDCSSDDSAARIMDLARRHDFVTALRNPANLGAGVARNTAFPHATGRYTLFFDADDRLHADVLADALAQLDREEADVGMFAYNYERDASDRTAMLVNDERIWFGHLGTSDSRTGPLADFPNLLGFTNYPWNKILRTAHYQDPQIGLKFGDTKVNNDILGHWYTLLFARRIVLFNKVICSHIVYSDGANLTNQRDTIRLEMFAALQATYALLAAHPDLRQRYCHHYWEFAMKLADWARSRLSESHMELFRAELQALVAEIDLSDYARISRRRSPALGRRIMSVLLS